MQITILVGEKPDYQMKPGEAYKVKWHIENSDQTKDILVVCCYKCGKTGWTMEHDHQWHDDGTVTINPSMLCPHCNAHYFVRASQIVE